jgi:hypothetical protein
LLALELLLLNCLSSDGSCGFNPDALAKRFKMSVKETTPERRPDIFCEDCIPDWICDDVEEAIEGVADGGIIVDAVKGDGFGGEEIVDEVE